MYKFLLSSLLFCISTSLFAFPTSSLINLGVSGEIKPQSSDANQPAVIFIVPLDKLIKNVQYDVTCVIYNNNLEPVDIRFDISQPQGGGYGLFTLNDVELDNNQTSIPIGNNNVINVPVLVYDTGSILILKNLDFSNSLTLSSCTARPIINHA